MLISTLPGSALSISMPHHWLKMRVEEKLFASGLPFTILQPAAYMQNVLAYCGT